VEMGLALENVRVVGLGDIGVVLEISELGHDDLLVGFPEREEDLLSVHLGNFIVESSCAGVEESDALNLEGILCYCDHGCLDICGS